MTPELVQALYWFLPLVVWDGIWKSIALWKAAQHKQLGWYIALILLNSVGILPIVYLMSFQKNAKPKEVLS